MIQYGHDIPNGSQLTTQVCIVGTGPAGVTLAWYLLRRGLDVILLEGSRDLNDQPGGDKYNNNTLLYNGESTGLLASNEPDFLIRPQNPNRQSTPSERERSYGGTSTHWGGQSRPLDPLTFAKRPGFPGWPITRDEIDPWYQEACRFMQLYGDYYSPEGTAGFNFSAEFWARTLDQQVTQLDGFDQDIYQFPIASLLQFQTRTVGGQTIGESNAKVILNASLLDISHQQGSVNKLTVASMSNDPQSPQKATEFSVMADHYVIACGAVANARQLLLSNVGNDYGNVGRYFMCHPFDNYQDPVTVNASSYLTSSQQRLMSYQGVSESTYGIRMIAGKLTPNAQSASSLEIGRCWFGAGGTNFYYEVTPCADSKINLANTTDPVFGQAQTHIDWQLSRNDEITYERATALFKSSVEKLGGGPVNVGPWSEVKNHLVINGHHLGTTRMSAQPEDGVVDSNLKVHATDNLYIAGSSVWASPGVSNPTLTIIALSIRLADHLAKATESA